MCNSYFAHLFNQVPMSSMYSVEKAYGSNTRLRKHLRYVTKQLHYFNF